jgi:soluble lytic murein transglycosylase-like protein
LPLAVRPTRTVLLLDFSRPTPTIDIAISDPQASNDLTGIARAMASQFTGAPLSGAVTISPSAVAAARLGNNPTTLRNPFVTYALSRHLVAPTFPSLSATMGKCVSSDYMPSSAFGRRAEERRRIIFPLVHQAACEAGLPIGLLDAMIMQESRYQPAAVSPKGAVGLAQLMPGTALQLGVDRFSMLENLRGGARYLKQQVDKFGRYDLALAAYNAGPARVERRWAVPRIAETQVYVQSILANWTSAAPTPTVSTGPLQFRRAQLVFMPASPQLTPIG